MKRIHVPRGRYTPNSMETEAPTLQILLDLVPHHLAVLPEEQLGTQGVTASTKAPVPCGVQVKEASLLWVSSSITIAVN